MSTMTANPPVSVRRTLGRLAPALLPLAALALLSLGQQACAKDIPDEAALTAQMAPLGLTVDQGSLREVSPDVLQFTANGSVFHLLDDGKHLVDGILLELDGSKFRNLTDERLRENAAAALKSVTADDLLVFKAQGAQRGRVYVFTDPTCGYCRRFHEEVPALNAAGIEVAYIPWARGTTEGAGFDGITAAWCSKDAQTAYTTLIADPTKLAGPGVAPAASCSMSAAVERSNALARTMRVQGSPAIFDANGRQLGGYVQADQLLKAFSEAAE